jgi:N-acyl-D-aspartate/D-glutamate deacylase
VLPDGRPVPGTYASRDELLAVAEVVRGRGLFQAVLNPGNFDHDLELITDVGRVTGGRVLITAVTVDPKAAGMRQATPDALEASVARGADITATVMPREGGSIWGLYAGLPFATPAWQALGALPHDQRLAVIRDRATRQALIDEATDARPRASTRRAFYMGADGEAHYMNGPELSLAALATAAGESPAETFLRMADESGGRAMFSVVRFNGDTELLADLLASERFLPGLGDAGAHLASIVDATYTTFFLSHWVRDTGQVELEEAIRRLTSAPADLLGLPDRGRLQPGAAADVNVIDLDALATLSVEPRYDAPAGAPRLVQKARGYRATLVNGETILRDDVHTTRNPGRVLRPA